MNLLTHPKRTVLPFLVTIVLACFGLLAQVQAINPTPDGCYPNFTTAEGCDALRFLTTGSGNTALGWGSLFFNSSGSFNTACGLSALLNNTTASGNTAVGSQALQTNTTGNLNTANGYQALLSNTTGASNTANGYQALINSTGSNNTAVGALALVANTTGDSNSVVGESALESNTTGSGNVAVGNFAGFNATSGDNNVYIGAVGGVAGESDACYIASIFGETSINGVPVLINSNNKLGTATSSKRFKKDIKPMDKASEALLALQPVTFRYRKEIDAKDTPQFGLIAEQVAEVNPALVIYDADGKPYTVRYDAVNAMLLNEFLKEHNAFVEQQRKVQEQGATIAQLKRDSGEQQQQIERLTAGLQKISAQLELSKRAQHPIVIND